MPSFDLLSERLPVSEPSIWDPGGEFCHDRSAKTKRPTTITTPTIAGHNHEGFPFDFVSLGNVVRGGAALPIVAAMPSHKA